MIFRRGAQLSVACYSTTIWATDPPDPTSAALLDNFLAIVMTGPDPDIDGFSAFTRDDLVPVGATKFDRA